MSVVVAMECAGIAILASACEAQTASSEARDAPLLAPADDGSQGQGWAPRRNTHYTDCVGDCDAVVFEVVFVDGCPRLVTPAQPNWRNCKDPEKKAGDPPNEYELTCTATKRGRTVVFAGGTHAYAVRFAPFGESIPVAPGRDSDPVQIRKDAPSAWYKFTVYVDDAKCEPFDPNIIVTD